MLLKISLAALGPAQSQFHRSLRPRAIGGILRAFIERHDDVGTQVNLRLHGTLRTKEVRRAIKMRTKRHALLADFAELVQAENLEAAGIGQNRPRPRHETMQTAHLAHGFDPGTQVEVISIAEKNLDSELFENILRHAFDGRDGAHGHEYGGFDLAVRSMQAPGTRRAGTALDMELNGHCVFALRL